ncbi:MAG TPA: molybdopterin-dependent oxidoreductase [Candidatus Onthenecus intestinigallinarum]|uniref:Molybdopterin-dependent oxidoreductase n=1 Tax=Candidatus Onthenecus intestinigallinarum TaxID=2840875 RepID=A0A9D0Z8N7_9FIRM|nr:molybdopterin-dependent oxidoreductase [Candidatus Onthenecus intestinigallinarum]
MKQVGQGVRKKDAMALLCGKPVYTQDLAPAECLCVKLLRSPHANAIIRQIDASAARRMPGVACVLTYEDAPRSRFTLAGQTYPEPSPYDRLILDRHVRHVGDPVAIVAAESERAAEAALRRIRVQYEVLPAVLDAEQALDHPVLVHPEDDWKALCDVGADNRRNLCAQEVVSQGDVEAELAACDVVVERTYRTQANQQCMMETFRAYSYMDAYGRLNVVSSTQVPFHVRRILANALEMKKSAIRVIKPRIGGGFGAKQTAVCEMYPALVTVRTGRPALLVFTREESMTASSPRHPMTIRVRLGATRAGDIRAMDMYTLSNTGAYGEHGPTTVGLSGHKSLPLYSRANAFRFAYDVVYTNTMSSGAYRGYGATQGLFAMESAINELAHALKMDPAALRARNMVREGEQMPAYYSETAQSCALDRCLARVREMIGWTDKYPRRVLENGHIRAVGLALAMQGSGISGVDTASASIRVGDDGAYNLMIGATDMGTGCDTILAQMAADCLDCDVSDIAVSGVDTDQSPYDTGSYASSTTYVTGMAVVKACGLLREKIVAAGAQLLGCAAEDAEFDGTCVRCGGETVSLRDVANRSLAAGAQELFASASHGSPVSPPPFMAGAAEVDIDPETGEVRVVDYCAAVDCGTVVNPNLARVQTEGGIAQGIGMALYEDVRMTDRGRMMSNSFMQYKIPTRLDVPSIRVEFEQSYEPTGPFGAKSIGEIVINTPAPAIADAVYNAVGVRVTDLPITPEKVLRGMGRL